MTRQTVCLNCGAEQDDAKTVRWRCPDCGSAVLGRADAALHWIDQALLKEDA